jgi:RNA polymerase subunit RPABC4/transcription elongation factor Spt4
MPMIVCSNPRCHNSLDFGGGNMLVEGDNFCPACGSRTTQPPTPIMQCRCGKIMRTNANFCTVCSAGVGQARQISQAEAEAILAAD